MIVTKLIAQLEPHLIEAEEVWVAVALLKDRALDKILTCVPSDSIQHYLVGINLPTSPSSLEKLMTLKSAKLSAVIFGSRQTFHPKLYLVKKSTGYIAFLGSANATMGGFSTNVELSFFVTDQAQCIELRDWFESMIQEGKEITEDFLVKYKEAYRKNLKWRSAQESNLNAILENSNDYAGISIVKEGQFFTQSDFQAYNPIFHSDASELAKGQRRQVRNRLLKLHDLIYLHFNSFLITDLHAPANRMNYTSQYFHSRGHTNDKDAIWLNYGKSELQLKHSSDGTFVNNNRIQIILRHNIHEQFIGIWLFIGKPNKSREDREYLKTQIQNPVYLELLYDSLMELGDSYWIQNKEVRYFMSELADISKLFDFLNSDDFRGYYKIGRNYDPNNENLSIANIKNTVLTEFSKLFKIYRLVRKP